MTQKKGDAQQSVSQLGYPFGVCSNNNEYPIIPSIWYPFFSFKTLAEEFKEGINNVKPTKFKQLEKIAEKSLEELLEEMKSKMSFKDPELPLSLNLNPSPDDLKEEMKRDLENLKSNVDDLSNKLGDIFNTLKVLDIIDCSELETKAKESYPVIYEKIKDGAKEKFLETELAENIETANELKEGLSEPFDYAKSKTIEKLIEKYSKEAKNCDDK